jgi:hypothetical protein
MSGVAHTGNRFPHKLIDFSTLFRTACWPTGVLSSESIQIWGLRRLSFTLLDREIGVPTAEYGR